MNAVEPLDGSEGACTGGNFLARRPRVKRHGAILGMQMHRSSSCDLFLQNGGEGLGVAPRASLADQKTQDRPSGSQTELKR
jgi:hypothetical protein